MAMYTLSNALYPSPVDGEGAGWGPDLEYVELQDIVLGQRWARNFSYASAEKWTNKIIFMCLQTAENML